MITTGKGGFARPSSTASQVAVSDASARPPLARRQLNTTAGTGSTRASSTLIKQNKSSPVTRSTATTRVSRAPAAVKPSPAGASATGISSIAAAAKSGPTMATFKPNSQAFTLKAPAAARPRPGVAASKAIPTSGTTLKVNILHTALTKDEESEVCVVLLLAITHADCLTAKRRQSGFPNASEDKDG